MSKELQTHQPSPVDSLKKVLNSKSVMAQFENALADNARLFTASIIDLATSDKTLMQCEPNALITEALKAATMKLPINKSLGLAYIVPFSKSVKEGNGWGKIMIPTLIIGYKGIIQLAIRSGVYKVIHADSVLHGELLSNDKLTGFIDVSGEAESDEVVGYFAHFETVNGYSKTLYMPIDKLREHGKKHSKSYGKDSSPWTTDFDAMAKKTVLRALLTKYGPMSIDFANSLSQEESFNNSDSFLPEGDGRQVIDVDPETGEVITCQQPNKEPKKVEVPY